MTTRLEEIVTELARDVAVLKQAHEETIRTREYHTRIIEGLSSSDAKITLALNEVSLKFEALIAQIGVGFRIIVICTGIVCTLTGAFWVYSHDLDTRYAPKLDTLVNTSARQNELLQTTKSEIANQQEQIDSAAQQTVRTKVTVDKMLQTRVMKATK